MLPRSSSYLLAALGAFALAAPAVAQPTFDHLGCYRVKDSRPKGRFNLVVTNAGVMQSCTVRVPAKFGCLQSAKSDIVPSPPGGGPSDGSAGNFLCYRVKCGKPFPQDAEMEDQFGGRRIVDFRGGQFLCAPAIRRAETLVSSTTTSTLPFQGQCRFNNSDRKCEGTCGGGGHCSATVDSGACECRSTSCGNADAPDCNGFCSNADEACIFSVDGCSCVRIP